MVMEITAVFLLSRMSEAYGDGFGDDGEQIEKTLPSFVFQEDARRN